MPLLTTFKPTRGELLRVRKRITLARRGHDLLKKKQDALIIEFFRLLKDIRTEREGLHTTYAKAVRQLSEARALESDLRIKATALAVQEAASINISARNVAGVRIPTLTIQERNKEQPPYDSLLLQDIGHAYRDVLERILRIAARETALRKILLEIKKTKRRTQALEHILIPQLEEAKQHIQFELEEQARENFARLKHRHAES